MACTLSGIGAGDFSGVTFIDSDRVNICIVGILKSPALERNLLRLGDGAQLNWHWHDH